MRHTIKLAPITLITFLFLLTTGCGRDTIKGEGEFKQEHREVQTFSGIDINGDYVIQGKIGKPDELIISSNPNILSHIKSSVNNGILTITNDDHVNLQPTATQNLWFTAEAFHSLRLSGDTQFQLINLTGTDLDCDLSGSHKVMLKGKLTTLKIVTNGTANVDARDLQVKDADIEINGSGTVAVNASDNLKVNINGDGQVVYYNGKPKIEQTIKGSGQVSSAFGALEH